MSYSHLPCAPHTVQDVERDARTMLLAALRHLASGYRSTVAADRTALGMTAPASKPAWGRSGRGSALIQESQGSPLATFADSTAESNLPPRLRYLLLCRLGELVRRS